MTTQPPPPTDQRLPAAFDHAPTGVTLTTLDGRCLAANRAYVRMLGYSPDELAGLAFADVTHPDDLAGDRRQLERLVSGELESWRGERRYLRQDGERVEVLMQTDLVRRPDGTPEHFITHLVDITERKRVEQELACRVAQQAAAARLGEQALSGLSLRELVREAARVVARTLHVEYAGVLELTPDGKRIQPRAAIGWPEESIPESFALKPDSHAGYTLASDDPVVIEDVLDEDRIPDIEMLRRLGIRSGVSVLVRGRRRPFGVLGAHSRRARKFSRDDVGFLQAVANVIGDAAERESWERRLEHQAHHDALTGLPNRVLLVRRLKALLRRQRVTESTVAVLFLDIDHFKLVNDTHGHEVGDDLLKAVAERLRGAVRPDDFVARFGGDEFVLVCSGVRSQADGVALADRVLQRLARPVAVGSAARAVSASIGIAVSEPAADDDAELLLRNADAAVHRAKDLGRGRRVLFDEEMRRRLVRRVQIGEALGDAVREGQVVNHYQPIVSLADSRPVAFEALARWHHPRLGRVAPDVFIPVAEETGAIVALGERALEQACADAVRHARTGAPPVTVSVNLSPRQVTDAGLVAAVRATLARTGLPAELLRLEITETALMEDTPVVANALNALSEMGVRLVLDDFGTGYSSLSYLRRFPIHSVKIDRSFVAGLGADDADAAIVEAVISMAGALGVEVVAEGVETPEQADALARLGCRYAQGYLYGKPAPWPEASAALVAA